MSKEETPGSIGEIAYGPSTSSVEWKIRDYFKTPQEVDRALNSPTFNYCDSRWYLKLYPNGENKDESEGWISLYVMKLSESPKHQMKYRLGILRRDGSEVKAVGSNSLFDGAGRGRGWKYLKVSYLNLERDELVPEGVLTVFCTVSMNTSPGVTAAVQTKRPPGVEKLVHDFKDLLLSGEAADVTLNVGNREFKVHRAVLVARSAVFSAMMKNEMTEKSSGVVQIDDCDPEAFQQFLAYMYTGDLENFSADNVFDLHGISDKYQTDELKARCVQFMGENLSVEIFCDVLALSVRHDESELRETAFRYFAKNMEDILVTVKWLSFVKENPVEANEMYIKGVKYNAKLE